MNICILSSLLVFASIHLTQASTTCSDAYSCEFSEKISPSECSGYYSCAFSNLLETNNAKCSGSFSCYEILVINMTTSTFDLTCSGLYSCANVDSIGHYSEEMVSKGLARFNCDGELSCFGSTFKLSGSSLSCNGDRSCLNSNVTLHRGAIEAVGYLSAANSVFTIKDAKSDIRFVGMESGKNTTVICSGTNTTCRVFCYNNACDELRLIRDTNSHNNVFEVDCQHAFKSDVCPDGIDFETELIDALSSMYGDVDDWYNQSVFSDFSMPVIPSLYDNVTTQFTNLEDSIDTCAIASNMSSIIPMVNNSEFLNNSDIDYVIDTGLNNEYPINCMDTFECEQDILGTKDFVDDSISSITVPICCTAASSCYSSSNLKNEISESDTSSIGIRCDGAVSCEAGSSNGTYMRSNGNIYVSGSSNLNDFMVIDGKDSDNNELFCNGADTCQISPAYHGSGERRIRNFQNVFCNGDSSCENIDMEASNLTFENIGNSVFFYGGTSAGQGMKFNNIGNSVYCVGGSEGGCSYSMIENVMGSVYSVGFFDIIGHSTINNVTNVYGIGGHSMRYNTILNVKNNAYFIGNGAGEHSMIQNVQNLVAIGDDALFNSNITQVKTILISGSDCLSNTNISSNFGDSARWSQSDRILTLKINCDTTYDFDVYCSQNDTCNIDCMTKGACDDMDLHCDGVCNVSKVGSGGNDAIVYIAIGCAAGGVVLAVIIFAIYQRRKKSQSGRDSYEKLDKTDGGIN